MKTVIIVGTLPRCRTAWLAELLNIRPISFAFHEAMNGCDFVDRWAEKILARPESIVVDCNPNFWASPGLYEVALREMNHNVHVKYVFIERDEQECLESFVGAFAEQCGFNEAQAERAFDVWIENKKTFMPRFKNSLVVRYEDIDKSVFDILEFCGLPYEKDRVDELLKKIIVQNVPEMLRRYA